MVPINLKDYQQSSCAPKIKISFNYIIS